MLSAVLFILESEIFVEHSKYIYCKFRNYCTLYCCDFYIIDKNAKLLIAISEKYAYK